MKRPAWVLGLVLVGGSGVAAVGCGGDDGPKAMPGMVNTTIARSSVQQSVMVRTAADSMNGAAVASAVMALNGSASGMVQPKTGTAGALLNAEVEQTAQAQSTAGVTCDANGCKYTNYMAGGSTLNGTVNVSAGSGDAKNVKWDLTIKNNGLGGTGGFAFDYTGSGDIQVSATSLAGEVRAKSSISGSQGGQSIQGGSDSLLRYTAVTIANGQPTGGTLYAKTTSYGSSGGQSAAQAYEGTLEFGK
jgi:hypothetical protein